jgi:hypothetical protein
LFKLFFIAGESWYLAICTPTEDKDQNGRRIYVVNKQRVETGIRAGGRVSVNLPEGTLYTKARLLDGSKVTDKIEADSPKIPAQKSAVANETSGTNIKTIDTEEEMDI